MKVQDKLGKDRFKVRETSHIVVEKQIKDMELAKKLCLACPAGLYSIDAEGNLNFSHLGCLECGTCRIACGGTIVEKWVNPGPTMGVEYRFG